MGIFNGGNILMIKRALKWLGCLLIAILCMVNLISCDLSAAEQQQPGSNPPEQSEQPELPNGTTDPENPATPEEPESPQDPLPDLASLVADVHTIYDGTEQSALLTQQSWFDNQTMQFTAPALRDAATYSITITRTTDQASATLTFTIAPRNLTIAIASCTQFAGTDLQPLSATLVNGSLAATDTFTALFTLSTTADPDLAGEYSITGTALNNNYDITFTSGTYTVLTNPLLQIGTASRWEHRNGSDVYHLIITPTSATSGTYSLEESPDFITGNYRIVDDIIILQHDSSKAEGIRDNPSFDFVLTMSNGSIAITAVDDFYAGQFTEYTDICTWVFQKDAL